MRQKLLSRKPVFIYITSNLFAVPITIKLCVIYLVVRMKPTKMKCRWTDFSFCNKLSILNVFCGMIYYYYYWVFFQTRTLRRMTWQVNCWWKMFHKKPLCERTEWTEPFLALIPLSLRRRLADLAATEEQSFSRSCSSKTSLPVGLVLAVCSPQPSALYLNSHFFFLPSFPSLNSSESDWIYVSPLNTFTFG